MPVFKFFNGFPSFKKLFIYFWLCRVFVAAWTFLQLQRAGPTLQGGVQAPNFGGFSCRGARALGCAGFSRYGSWAQWWWFPGSTAVAHGLSCLAVCGIFPDQGLKPCPLHGQAHSLPLSHQGHSPLILIKDKFFALYKVKRHLAPDHLSYLVFHIPPSTRPQALSVCLSLSHTHTHHPHPPTSAHPHTHTHTHTYPLLIAWRLHWPVSQTSPSASFAPAVPWKALPDMLLLAKSYSSLGLYFIVSSLGEPLPDPETIHL